MLIRNNRFTTGLLIGSIIGATVGMMNTRAGRRIGRKLIRAGREVLTRRNGLIDVLADLL